MRLLSFSCLFIAILCWVSCQKAPIEVSNQLNTNHLEVQKVLNLPYNTFDYNDIKMPTYLQKLGMQASKVDNNLVTLGRVLFYDPTLSRDGKVSCASCHRPEFAFAEPLRFSKGVYGRISTRNSPALTNVAQVGAHYSGLNTNVAPFFWDMRATTVAEQSRQTLANPHEMDMDPATLVQRVREKPYYQVLFREAFQTDSITETQILNSLQEFVSALSAHQTRFDKAMDAATNPTLTVDSLIIIDTLVISNAYYSLPLVSTSTSTVASLSLPTLTFQENVGGAVFVTNCSSCHSPIRPFQSIFSANIGLNKQYHDQGLGQLTGKASDNGVFKAPPLRNIALTAPYMHDGRFQTLEQVVDFYNTGIQDHPNLHPILKASNGQPKRLNLTASQKSDLVAFLKTFTDNRLANDLRYTTPFK